MKDKHIDILIVSREGKGVKGYRLNKSLLKIGLSSLAVSLVGLLGFSLFSIGQNVSLKREIARLEEEKRKLSETLTKVREENKKLTAFKEKVKQLEAKLSTLEKFLRKRGIRKIPSGIGGPSKKGSSSLIDLDYVDFLIGESEKIYKDLRGVPLGMPVWGRITSKYGYRRDPFNGRIEFHEGVDIKARWGTPVRATADGKVIFAGRKWGYGKAVIIKHKHGFRTLYGHLSKIKVKRGQRVKAGDIIGYVGSTGRSTGPHVHYEVWRYSKKQNPYKYMFPRW